jgi:hypothetical protein
MALPGVDWVVRRSNQVAGTMSEAAPQEWRQ